MLNTDGPSRVLSGAQPSGFLTIGNYLGALQNWVGMQDKTCIDPFFFVADLHAMSSELIPNNYTLSKKTLNTVALYLAIGLDPLKSTIFLQSYIPEHTELMWILMSYMSFGDLSRMTQFKDKSSKSPVIKVSLFSYPCLMAADILLYRPDAVPVGQDQTQHLELTRETAKRFNKATKTNTFTAPKQYTIQAGAKIMSLTEPNKKMSKSDKDIGSYISILDEPEVILAKIQRSQTDSIGSTNYNKDLQPGISNLIEIYSCFSGETIEKSCSMFEGGSYSKLKSAVAESIIEELTPIQLRYNAIRADEELLKKILRNGSDKARIIASDTLTKVKAAVGIL